MTARNERPLMRIERASVSNLVICVKNSLTMFNGDLVNRVLISSPCPAPGHEIFGNGASVLRAPRQQQREPLRRDRREPWRCLQNALLFRIKRLQVVQWRMIVAPASRLPEIAVGGKK
ncbi:MULTISPECIES: hypothetical protein [unclassified Rhizobium]|uniref:hypothetical protein n=1 Tax=unclassified Rhizobium TaxID=2613769 RepID=UPI001ADD1B84|nr:MULTISPECIES: hypothetical protein [unclassified Rhizobium]MBO9100467.1 hypothetical protein [Rhizobium sp. L58/93]MBO9136171.1 hypothetical protein [Rhizobium sp. B209b/85]MBO9171482.1 hypothetical protein [Rhizobium sp. L245/93]MBO9187349.1 hypothetical protein [Rhizobium sp. E27B/91]QXZ88140.1 hypothetical protein J5287_29050 [Rhizobium sp. K1/93]